jgi:hypothetical protein
MVSCFYLHIYFVQHFIVKFKIGMRTKVAVSSVIDGGRKLVEVEAVMYIMLCPLIIVLYFLMKVSYTQVVCTRPKLDIDVFILINTSYVICSFLINKGK